MSLTVICVSEHVNHRDGEKSFGYTEDAHDDMMTNARDSVQAA